ncbi:MAG: YHS domain-containing (seleno)protein [Nitrospirota bacterium]
MKKLVSHRFLTLLLAVVFATPAFAGEYFERDGVAISGYDPVAYFVEMKPVTGLPEFHAEYQGSVFYFSTAANRDAFTANPDKFAPQYGGYCAFGMAKGYKAVIDPDAFTVVGDKLYLNYSETVRSQWVLDIPGYISKANANWPEIRKLSKVHE